MHFRHSIRKSIFAKNYASSEVGSTHASFLEPKEPFKYEYLHADFIVDHLALATKHGGYLCWSSGWHRRSGETVFGNKPGGSATSKAQKEKELRRLTRKISGYARGVHKRYPTGDVVVSRVDLAMELRKSPEAVAAALSLMLGEQRVQRAALNGYWKLDV